MNGADIYDEIVSLLKENNIQRETRIICACMLKLYNEFNFIRKMLWVLFTTNIGLFSSIVFYISIKS